MDPVADPDRCSAVLYNNTNGMPTSEANAIAETTDAKVLTFHSCQTVSRQDYDNGATYLSLMWHNVEALKEGLA